MFLGHPGSRRRDIPDKNLLQWPFSVVLDREWPGCPGIWVGTSRIWKNFMQDNFGLSFRTLTLTKAQYQSFGMIIKQKMLQTIQFRLCSANPNITDMFSI